MRSARSSRSARNARVARGTSAISATAKLQALVAALGGWWWDGRTGIVLATGVSSWTDRVQGFAVSQGTGNAQPAYAGGILTFDGANDTLTSASNPFNGATAYTIDIIGSMPAWGAGTPALLSHGGAAGGTVRGLLYANGASGLQDFAEAPGATQNNWSSTATAMAAGVYTFQADIGAGAAACTAVLKNGTTLGGARTISGALSGTFTTGSGIAFAAVVGGSLFANLSCYAIVAVPTVTAAQNTQRIALERSIYGV